MNTMNIILINKKSVILILYVTLIFMLQLFNRRYAFIYLIIFSI